VNNVLEFFVKMKDMMSGGLVKLASTAKQKFSDVKNYISDVIRKNDELASSFDRTATKAQSSGSRMLSWAKNLAVALGATALVAGTGAFLKSSAQAAIQHEKTTKSFEVLAGNRGIGQSLASGLNDLQQQTVLGPEVFKNAQTMMAFGITAEKVIPNLKMLGDVSGGDAERLQSLTLAFSQVSATGRLTGQDLLQFVNAGFNPLNEIAKMTGKSMVALRKDMEDGKISFDMVNKAFEHATGSGGLFNNMLDRMGETTGGKIAQLQGSFESLKITVGERMKPAIGSFVSGLTSVVDKIKSWVDIPLETKLTDQITKIRALQAELTASNTSHARQVELLHELEQINPNIIKGINEQNIEYGKLAKNINDVTGALQKKIFLEKFDKSNASVLTDYASANESYDRNVAESMAIVAMFPDLAQSNMTLGQKQVEAQKRLKARIAADPNKGTVHHVQGTGMGGFVMTNENNDDVDALIRIRRAVEGANKANAVLGALQPKVSEINKTKNALTAQIDQFTGVKSMTAAQVQNSGGKAGGATSGASTGKDVASGITGGGPRVININGVKFADKIEIHAGSMGEAADETERRLEEMFLRVLNSGASVQ
jgi:tape measure domain-containing protein